LPFHFLNVCAAVQYYKDAYVALFVDTIRPIVRKVRSCTISPVSVTGCVGGHQDVGNAVYSFAFRSKPPTTALPVLGQ
jgi:hypothetical protein